MEGWRVQVWVLGASLVSRSSGVAAVTVIGESVGGTSDDCVRGIQGSAE